MKNSAQTPSNFFELYESLNNTQKEISKLIAEGFTNKEIASKVRSSVKTQAKKIAVKTVENNLIVILGFSR